MITPNDQPKQEEYILEQYANIELERFIQEQESRLKGRKLISEALLFIGCQVLSNALAILLFQYALRIWVTYLIIWAISLAPAMPDLCNVHFNQEENGWRITIMDSPLKSVIKIVFGMGITFVGIVEVRDLLIQTQYGINQVYAEIQAYEMPKSHNYDLVRQLSPMLSLGVATALVFLVMYLKERR